MAYLDALIFGLRTLLQDTSERPLRSRVSFGAGFTATDDPTNDWTRVEVTPTGVQGDANGIFACGAAVQKWSPSSPLDSTHLVITAGCFTTTTSGTPSVDMFPHLGDPTPLELDAVNFPDFVAFASAIVTAKFDDADFASYRVSRTFTRHAGAAVVAGAATSDDGKDRQGTAASVPWPVPVLAWDAATSFPKITVDQGAEVENIDWRATISVVVHRG